MHLATKCGSCAATPRSLSSGGVWPAARRPTKHNDGHWSSTWMVGANMFSMCAVTCAGAPDTLCTCPERGAP
eukprot:4428016-Pyramimonas_sp.AAC.1